MKKYLQFVALSFLFFTLLISCSSEKPVEGQEIFVEVSQEIRVYYADTDLTSAYPFPYSTFLDDTTMLSFNMIRNAIDTLYFDGDSLKVIAGNFLKNDGPRKVEGLSNIVRTSFGLVLFNAKNIMIDQDGYSDIVNQRLINSSLFDGSVFFGLNHGVSFYLDHFFRGYDQRREKLFFFTENFQTKEFKLVSFDLSNGEFSELPMWADTELIRKNEVRHEGISKNNMPFIYVYRDQLVISYNYSSEFVLIDLNTFEVSNKSFSSSLFPLSKTARIEIPENLKGGDRKDFMEVMKIMGEWDQDVAFGNFEKLPNGKGFCRLVKSPQSKIEEIEQVNLEIFDQSFEKVGEVNLTEINANLSTFFFAYADRLFFKAKNQDNENYLNYYFVSIDF
ncbi:MAG: hypothetical protein ACXIUD_18735 [Mongoliitalea sp.]